MNQSTFLVNGRRVVHAQANGLATALSMNFTGPNLLPIPYSVRGDTLDLQNTCSGLTVNGAPCATIESYLSRCFGDEAGDGGGIFSGSIGGRCDFITGSTDTLLSDEGLLRIDGKPVLREEDLCLLNQRNSAPAPLLFQDFDGSEGEVNALDTSQSTDSAKPYRVSFVVLDVSKRASLDACSVFNEKERVTTHLAEQSSDSNDRMTRHTVLLSEDKSVQLALSIPVTEGAPLLIPLTSASQKPIDHDKPLPAHANESNVFIPVLVSTHLIPEESSIHPVKTDDSDLLRLPARLRAQIYESMPSSSTQTWYETLSPALKRQVDASWQALSEGSLRPGYLYVFLNKTLWRECQVLLGSMLREVDLSRYAGLDLRPSVGLPSDVLYLPYQIAGEQPLIEIAYSEVAWSWARIQYFGGVDHQDMRFVDRDLAQPLQDVATLQTRRSQRFLRFDFSNELMANPKSQVSTNNIRCYAHSETQTIPMIYLPDPLAGIRHALADITILLEKAKQDEGALTSVHRLQNTLVGLMGGAALGISKKPPNLLSSSLIAWEAAALDYFSLGSYRYERAFEWASRLMQGLSTKPLSSLVTHYLQTCFEERNPWAWMLFAPATSNGFEQALGGHFQASLMAHTWHAIEHPSLAKLTHAAQDLIPSALNRLVTALLASLPAGNTRQRQAAYEIIYRTYQSSEHPLMSVISMKEQVDVGVKQHGVLGYREPPQDLKVAQRLYGRWFVLTAKTGSAAAQALLQRVLQSGSSVLQPNAFEREPAAASLLATFSRMNSEG